MSIFVVVVVVVVVVVLQFHSNNSKKQFLTSVLLMPVRQDDMSPSGNTFLGTSDIRLDL